MKPVALASIPALDSLQRLCLRIGIGALALCVVGGALDPAQFFQSYLLGFLFWSGIALGCLAIVMLHHLSGGRWGILIRRVLESGTRTLPLVALMFVPLLFGMKEIWVWARPEAVAADELLQHKVAYLNVPFFIARLVLYFAIWLALSYLLNRWSQRQDETGDPDFVRRFQLLSAPGLVLFVLTMTFASVDWVMSLEPHWFSTIYGALFIVGQVLGAFCLVVAVVVLLSRHEPLASINAVSQFHDLGKLLLAFVMVWAYFGFSQFLIIWSGNLPEEIPWYLKRVQGGWQWAGTALLLLHFVLPFLMLLSRNLKRNAGLLARVAILILVMRLVDLYWMMEPAFHENIFEVHWLDLAAPVGLGGIWLFVFLGGLKKRPLLPAGDPYVASLVSHEAD